MLAPGFEWFVAWRHLRDPERQSRRTLILGLAILTVGLAALASVYLGIRPRTTEGFLAGRPSLFFENMKLVGILATIAGTVITFLGVLFASFTVFTAISMFGVFLGTCTPIVALSVMSGFENDLKSKLRGAKADVVITVPHDRPFSDWEAVRRRIAALPGVAATTPYVEGEVMIRSASNPAGIILKGIDPATAADVLSVGRSMREGKIEYLTDPSKIPAAPGLRGDSMLPHPGVIYPGSAGDAAKKGGEAERSRSAVQKEQRDKEQRQEEDAAASRIPAIIIGEVLYLSTLHVFVGSVVDVACPLCGVGPTGPVPKMRRFRVAGHFYSGMYEFDQKLAYVSLIEAQRFLRLEGEVSGVEVRTTTPELAREVADSIGRVLGPGYETRSWEELNRGLFMALRLEKIAMFIVLTFIALVAAFSIKATLLMLVSAKAREVAILKSMGARNGAILRIFIAEGLYIGLLGMAVGVSTGIAGCILISRHGLPLDPDVYYIQRLPVVMRVSEIVAVALAALVLCCLATLYPAFRASRMRPVAGLRYE